MLSATGYEIPHTRHLHFPFSSSHLHALSPTRKSISAVSPVCRLCHPWVPGSQTCADKLRTSMPANFIPNPQILCVLHRFVLYTYSYHLSNPCCLSNSYCPNNQKPQNMLRYFASTPVWMLQADDLQGSTSQFAFYFSLLLHTLKHGMRICKCNIFFLDS